MWLFFGITGLLTAALSGHPSPAPPDQLNTSSAESELWEPGERLPVRLTNGSSSCSGTVEVRLEASWEPACGALWDSRAAEAVCRALGCGGAEAASQLAPPTPELPPPPAAGNTSVAANATLAGAPALLCSGAEWRLCEVVEHACRSDGRRARVTCAENRALRLVDGGGACAGRVEMLEHGEWGSVCDDTWDLEDAHVVCRQLGCGWAVQALPGLHFTPGRGPIHRDQVNCSGAEAYLWDCPGLPGQHYCGHKEDAGAVCSASRSLHNLSTPEVPASVQTVTIESSVTVKIENKESRELMLLIPSIVLGILLLGSLIFIAFILLRIKGKYALPVMVNHQHLPTTIPAGSNSYQPVPITIPKEVFMLPIQVQAPPPEDSDSGSDSDYEHYDFSAQPPVALTTFYNSQRHRVTDEEVQQSRFQMPPLEEGLEELHASHIPTANPGHCITDPPSLGPQYHPRSNSESSTSSGEDYCNSPKSKLPPWNPQVFSSERSSFLEQPPNLELAGTQPAFSAGPPADDSSSTSSGEWYQNFQPPPQPPSEEQFGCPGSPSPQPDSTDNDDYDDISAA
ncbi:T-cell differentiation antigen CD6 isoform X7 [Homo sapiens]|uniref:Isoform 7 of T-cell differentiation antigen CD6 n=1 Tax=Homo sapiens TaxID=9606 RepID=P30203-7|nr:T-cell differentiation antigen CD6 isoform X7 [Homo sapiens]|eukprot:XP_011543664.1 T-cell differentiation antigen CD6 isoform X6 [Homo sapiens]